MNNFWKGMGGCGCCLIEDTVVRFAWRDRGEPQETSVLLAGVQVEI
jgi:hypothetical protein